MFLLYNFPLQMQLNLKKLPKCQNDINVYQPSEKRKLNVFPKKPTKIDPAPLKRRDFPLRSSLFSPVFCSLQTSSFMTQMIHHSTSRISHHNIINNRTNIIHNNNKTNIINSNNKHPKPMAIKVNSSMEGDIIMTTSLERN